MKAAVYYETGSPDVFRYEDVPDPKCHPAGVLIDVKAISIEGGDVLNRTGGAMTASPHVVGYQCAGVVREVGERATDREPGQRVVAVMGNGSHASVVSVPARATWPIPDGLSIEDGACVPIAFGTADDCLFEFGRLTEGETVLVQAGAGGVGLAAIQLAKRAGATVIATASSDAKLERLKSFGMDVGVNYASGDFVAAVRSATAGQGVNLVVDSVGGSVLQGSIASLAYRGRAITVGSMSMAGPREEPPAPARVDTGTLTAGNRSLTGVFLGAEMQTPRVQQMIAGHLADVAKGELKVVIDRTFPLAEAADAHRHIESRKAFGRVVLVP